MISKLFSFDDNRTNYSMDIKLNEDLLKAKVFHGLKSLFQEGDTLDPRFLELAVCEAFGLYHTGDGNFFADGVTPNVQASIKTRKLDPEIRSRKDSRDFQSHPSKFLEHSENSKQGLIWNGIQIIQRRQAFIGQDDLRMEPELVGHLSIEGFKENILESKNKFNTKKVYEIIVIHGYDRTKKNYILSLYWQEYNPLDAKSIQWHRDNASVIGTVKKDIDGVMRDVIVCQRINGNAKRCATNFIEYKNPTKYTYSASIRLPIPDPWKFDKDAILQEIDLKGERDETIL